MSARVFARPAGTPPPARRRIRRVGRGILGAAAAFTLLSSLTSAPAAAVPATVVPDGGPATKSEEDVPPDPRGAGRGRTGSPAASAEKSASAGSPAASAEKSASAGAGIVVETEGEGTGLWVVQLADPSLATYAGGIDDLEPTSPQITGAAQLDVDTAASEAYLDYLDDQQDEHAADIDRALDRSVEVEFRYHNVVNGLAVRVDDDEAAALAELPGVAAVYRDVEREIQTDVSHDVIRSASIWDGQTAGNVATRGEGVVVGVIDGGINPFHPSFAATDGAGFTHTNPYGAGTYTGVCDPDHPKHEDICNDKLIGAWNLHPSSPSAQDTDDHGSHVASTIAGNVHDADFTLGGTDFTRTVQGVAPHANVISYLVCFPLCPGTSSVAAVDQAIADGVDVLNYSISGADNPWNDIVDQAFLEAFNAGIFVAAAAGNDGPGARTVAHTGPWNAAVAATTHTRAFVNTLDVTGPEPVPPGLTDLPAAPGSGPAITDAIDGEIADAAAVAPGNDDGCAPFPAGAFDGKLAMVDRGECTFAIKVNNAVAAGAVGVIVANNVAGPPTVMGGLESTSVPSVMVGVSSGTALREFMASNESASVRINASTALAIDDTWQDFVAGFSSRGPSRLDVLAPSFAAPGVDVLAAAAAEDGDADQYTVISGTSMASPHGAGAGALLTALHPDWSPAEIRSALASTADTDGVRKEDGTTPADPFDIGSGRLNLDSAGRAGLVLDETHSNFQSANPSTGGDPRTLNLPAVVDTDCAGTCSWTRTVKNVAAVETAYAVDVTAPAGLSVTVEPAEFTVTPGSTQAVEITVEVDLSEVAQGEPAFAEVRFSTDTEHADGGSIAAAHIPVVVTPQPPVPDDAGITLDPKSISSTQSTDDVVTRTLTIGNDGTADLEWAVHEDEALRTPYGETTEVDTVDQSAPAGGDHGLARDQASTDEPAETLIPDRSPTQDSSELSITHSTSQAVTAGNSIACSPDDGATTTENAFLRAFNLADFGITGDFDVVEVEFGIENITAEQDLTVNLFTMIDPDAPLTYGNLEPVGSSVETFGPQELTLATVPVTGRAETGTTLVVEVEAPDMTGAGGFWPGSNQAGQSAPSYIRAGGCGLDEPADMATIGFPTVHLVMNVTGVTEAPVCAAPGGTPWADVAPQAGTVAPGDGQEVEVTFDSTGVANGVYAANLCLSSNDPSRPLAVVPLTLEIGELPAIDVQPDSLDITQDAGTVTEQELTIGNTGDGQLDWVAFTEHTFTGHTDAREVRPLAGRSSPISAQPAPGTGKAADAESAFGTDASTAAEAGTTATLEAPAADEDSQTMTHSESLDVVTGNSVACTPDDGVTTRDHGYLRTFTLEDFGILGRFFVSDVSFGVESVSGAEQTVTVNLYTLDAEPLVYANMTRIGSADVTLAPQARSMVQVPVEGTVPGGATLVVEVDAPDMAGQGGFFIGSNGSGQTAPSYLRSQPCNLSEPTDTAEIGRPDMHMVMTVTGSTTAQVCAAADDVSWLALDPTSGTVAAGDTTTVAVTVDTGELDPGEYTATLCVTSNDPATPLVSVPVTLTVDGDPPGELTLTAETRQERGVWYADLTWTGAETDHLVDIHRDDDLVATVDNTGEHADNLGRPKKGDAFTYQVCEAGTDTCSESVTVKPRGDLGRPPKMSIATDELPTLRMLETYEVTLEADGGSGSYSWSATGLPEGLTLDEDTGVLTNDPENPSLTDDTSPVEVTVTVSDAEPDGTGKASANSTFDLEVVGVDQVAAGWGHTCAVATDATAYCWGRNATGQIGNGIVGGDGVHVPLPTQVRNSDGSGPLTDVAQIAGGDGHTCALTTASTTGETVYCWGAAFDGRLGNGDPTSAPQPLPVQVRDPDDAGPLTGVAEIVVGTQYGCALTTGQELYCWGNNTSGKLGIGSVGGTEPLPVAVRNSADSGPLTQVSTVSAGSSHACAVSAGVLQCWGGNSQGQLGNGTPSFAEPLPVAVEDPDDALHDVPQLAAGAGHSCALTTDDELYCWGSNAAGQLGNGTAGLNPATPVQVQDSAGSAALGDVAQVVTGSNHTCAVVGTNQAYCWGHDFYGQLGNGEIGDGSGVPLPVEVTNDAAGFGQTNAITAGHGHTCALTTDGGGYCWGANFNRQLGIGITGDQHREPRPVPVRPGQPV